MKEYYCDNPVCIAIVMNEGDLCKDCEEAQLTGIDEFEEMYCDECGGTACIC